MSYAMSPEFQTGVYALLSSSATLSAMVEGIYDAPPDSAGTPPMGTYITLGEEVSQDRSSASHHAVTMDFEIHVHTDKAGFSTAKKVAAEVVDILLGNDVGVTRGRVLHLKFLKSRARRGLAPETRRIVLIFRAILDDSII